MRAALIGQTLAHYRITAAIGAGGMGEVYRATDTKLWRDVALKVLPADVARDPKRLARFQREAKALAALDHPNIVSIYSVEEAEGVHFLTMQLVEGQALDRLIPEGGLPVERLVEIAMAMVEALAAAHDKGIVHRDLKPGNVMVAKDGRVKVLDFGLSKELRKAEPMDVTLASSPHTEVGVVMGTPAYMSPEQVAGRALDHRTDIFSLGVMLYEMATGRRPFEGRSSVELASAILRDTPRQLAERRSDLPEVLARAIERCLEKDPARRFQTARDVKAALEGPHRASGIGVAVPTRTAAGIIVLPFRNLSPDPDNEFFADGLTEEVIADLSGIRALRVISRTSAMHFKGTNKSLRAIAQELGVRYVLEGSVRRAGPSLRVTAQLIAADTDSHLWAEKYSGRLEDVFAIQEEVSRKIVDALQVRLTDNEARVVAERPIDDPAAYDCYLRARHEMYLFTPDALDRAQKLVDDGLALIGENALLLATKGLVAWNYVNASVRPEERYLDLAAECAVRALELDPRGYLGIFLRGLVAAKRGDLQRALRDLREAYERRPGDVGVLKELIRHHFSAGQEHTESARRAMEESLRVDPLEPLNWAQMAWRHLGAGRVDEVSRSARRVLDLSDPGSPVRTYGAYALALAGEREPALAAFEQVAVALPGTVYGSVSLFLYRALQGDAGGALTQVTPQLEQAAHWTEYLALFLADGYSLIGQRERALRWLRAAVDRGFLNFPYLAEHDPFLEALSGETAFDGLMQDVRRQWVAFES